MKIIRYELNGRALLGILRGDLIHTATGDMFEELVETGEKVALRDSKVLPPVQPSKIIGIGLNYLGHVKEKNFEVPEEPLIFLKPPSSVIAHLESIIYPENTNVVEFEGELGIVIGKKAKNVDESQALEYVLGYTVINDVSARDYQKKDKQWTRGKGFDTFCPVGPVIATGLDPDHLKIETRVNGKTAQFSTTEDLIFRSAQLISFISKVMTLLPGDLIATGTPSGVAPIKTGDIIEMEIEGIGILKNDVV